MAASSRYEARRSLRAVVATLFAAMPVGINAYLLAVRYKTETGMVAASVLVSTLLAPLTTLAWLLLLGRA